MGESKRAEIERTLEGYLETRKRAQAGEVGWDSLADFFTDDATFIDPAWGRVEGIKRIREFLRESMGGLEGWTFPHERTWIEGDRVVIRWQNRLPGARPDGSPYQATGVSMLVYAGDGRFSYEEDILNMAHVTELIRESGWKPGPGLKMPPANPER